MPDSRVEQDLAAAHACLQRLVNEQFAMAVVLWGVLASSGQVHDLADPNSLESLDALADDSNRAVGLSVAFHPVDLET